MLSIHLRDGRFSPQLDNNHLIFLETTCGHFEPLKLLLADVRVDVTEKDSHDVCAAFMELGVRASPRGQKS